MKKKILKMFLTGIFLILTLHTVTKYKFEKTETESVYFDNLKSDYNVNTTIQIAVTLDEAVKNSDPNIVKAARAAVYDFLAGSAKYQNYKYKVSQYMSIFDIKKVNENEWTVYYRSKMDPAEEFDKRFYSTVEVVKDSLGNFQGEIMFSTPEEH